MVLLKKFHKKDLSPNLFLHKDFVLFHLFSKFNEAPESPENPKEARKAHKLIKNNQKIHKNTRKHQSTCYRLVKNSKRKRKPTLHTPAIAYKKPSRRPWRIRTKQVFEQSTSLSNFWWTRKSATEFHWKSQVKIK